MPKGSETLRAFSFLHQIAVTAYKQTNTSVDLFSSCTSYHSQLAPTPKLCALLQKLNTCAKGNASQLNVIWGSGTQGGMQKASSGKFLYRLL